MVTDLLEILAEGAARNGVAALLALVSASAAVVIGLIILRQTGSASRMQTTQSRDESPPTFLFDGADLVDATPSGHRILRSAGISAGDLPRLLDHLAGRFPGLSEISAAAPDAGQYLSDRPSDDARLDIERWGNMTRLAILSETDDRLSLHPGAVEAMEREIETLREISEAAPLLIWQEDSRGAITWANKAYVQLADQLNPAHPGQATVWPPAQLFANLPPTTGEDDVATARLCITMQGNQSERWFEIKSRKRGAGTLNFASDIGEVVSAETQNRQFLQTMTKTFAQLSIGLAIFDRKRRLVIFNPALLDLTGLPISFLSGQPPIRAFLDRLREGNMIPEPSNYRTWREEVAALEVAAERGSYRESWSLTNGQTYRVTGRPHPDGAIALTFEDITAEISLTRSFRSELEIAQNVLDTLDEAIAVFSPAGTLWISNAAYGACWGHSAEAMDEVGFRDAIDLWQERSAPGPIWKEARKFATRLNDRFLVEGDIRRRDGRALSCRFMPLPGGASMVGFTPLTEVGKETKPSKIISEEAKAQIA
ncbi:PAS-domain containing protein [Ponticoccus sp. SC2-23]|uniref:PAS-domain containing protein n=1 Tax=Alexandriicola marinus TaxID=2081710 RepID=UPI000FDBBB4A|nr:PAS-domain containing protein [Alexandriicola marinus]MBM1220747.1 PAS-domain containing protein [Ponticoccus sp. SC6-9]MBM1226006.1 PAS-domain containing protein [Ponticoccus sp. SC6-15]MBM1231303.1 PAS-domain containing protein [Ponticoccus sp. SC6-38]MBM1235836.1 PAS-domain containing protein [Ponticoccus sp. SC6-45]MBM1240326.1 PAS-domain containing protein [Ponticoccus sp. SC6-49]MBM1244861.1 PAS-domain containing protein [Ponticoccus sp. SC2-64]MBM1249310.1 PAS-domain containing pro